MNKAIIESIEWHKDQIFKLLEDDDFVKIEGSIHSVKTDLNEIIEKAKAKKKVWVKVTAKKKGHYREMEVGRKEEEVGISDKTKVKDMSEKDIPEDVVGALRNVESKLNNMKLSEEDKKTILSYSDSEQLQMIKSREVRWENLKKQGVIPSNVSKDLYETIRMFSASPYGNVTTYYTGSLGDLKRDLGLD